jgi:vancomycin permeability regulator SanA
MRILKTLSIITVNIILLAAITLVLSGLDEHIEKADMIVVPGNTVFPDGTPSPRLQARLDMALKLYKEHHAPIIFVSGGTGVEGVDEAVAMFNYLTKNGIPSSAIVKDSLGINTAATARNAENYMRSNNLKSAIVATQYFHIPRTKLALERNGVQVAGTAYARYFEMKDIYSTLREVVAYPVYYAKL